MSTPHHKRHPAKAAFQSGVAVVEFLFAAPAFFILMFFVIEIALVWNDRHIMRLAAYRSARAVIKARAESVNPPNLCWKHPSLGGPIDPDFERVQTVARRSASKVMATVTPSVTQLLNILRLPATAIGTAVGQSFDASIEAKSIASFAEVDDRITSNPYVHAIVRMMKGLPAAWLFTDLRCEDILYPATSSSAATKGVEVTLVYHRPAKMPYIGSLMFLLRKLNEFAARFSQEYDGTSGLVRINPLSYGIELSPHFGAAGVALAEQQLRSMLDEKAAELAQTASDKINEHLSESRVPFSGIPSRVPSIFADIAGSAFDTAARGFQATSAYLQLTNIVNFVGNQALSLYLLTPDEIKTIPVTVAVRIPNYSSAYLNTEKAWDGKSIMLGTFTGTSKIDLIAKHIGQMIDTSNPPNGKGLPYAK